MNEENTTIMPPEKQIVQDDRDARAEELESAFSYDGYQVVRKELFAHLRDPAIVIVKIVSHSIQPVSQGWRMWSMFMSCSTMI